MLKLKYNRISHRDYGLSRESNENTKRKDLFLVLNIQEFFPENSVYFVAKS